MNGLIVISGRTDFKRYSPGWNRQFFTEAGEAINYLGFDRGAFAKRWEDKDKWNQNSPVEKIIFQSVEDDLEDEDVFCNIEHIQIVKKYIGWLKMQEHGKEESFLIFVNDEQLPKNSLPDFKCIGYDCGYLRGVGFYVLFSCLSNELLRVGGNEALIPFKKKINKYGLFDQLTDAAAFNQARDGAIAEGRIDGIETSFSLFSIVSILLYNPIIG